MAKQLEQQMTDVEEALGNLSLCLKLALDDKEQFIKEYGSRLYGVLCGISAYNSLNESKVVELLYNKDLSLTSRAKILHNTHDYEKRI